MTPIVNALPDTPESYYTDLHIRTRNIIERTIGLLKARFRCLLNHRVLHYEPKVAASIVNTCVILQNVCNKAKIPVSQLSDQEILEEARIQALMQLTISDSEANTDQGLRVGVDCRRNLICHLWDARQA